MTTEFSLPMPELVDAAQRTIIGHKREYAPDFTGSMDDQWNGFIAEIKSVSERMNEAAFGLLHTNSQTGAVTYMTGVEVTETASCPPGMDIVFLPASRYAVFEHQGAVEDLKLLWEAIFTQWLPTNHANVANGPKLEHYGKWFDKKTNSGQMEIWIPLRS